MLREAAHLVLGGRRHLRGSRRNGAGVSAGVAMSADVCGSGRTGRSGLGVAAHTGDLHRGKVGGGGVFGPQCFN